MPGWTSAPAHPLRWKLSAAAARPRRRRPYGNWLSQPQPSRAIRARRPAPPFRWRLFSSSLERPIRRRPYGNWLSHPLPPIPTAPEPLVACPAPGEEFDFPTIYRQLREVFGTSDQPMYSLLGLVPRMADLVPVDSSHQFIAGAVAQLLHDHSRAISYFERALQLCEAANERESFTFTLERMRESLPADPAVGRRLADAYLERGRRTEACAIWREQAKSLLDAGNLTDAIAAFETAHGIAPEDADALVGLSAAYRAAYGDLKAIEALNEALRSDPANCRFNLAKAISLARIGRAQAAESCVERALGAAWNDPRSLVWCWEQLGEAGLGVFQRRCRARLAHIAPERALELAEREPPEDAAEGVRSVN